MEEQSLPMDIEKLLEDLHSSVFLTIKEAIEALGQMPVSDIRVVEALMRVREEQEWLNLREVAHRALLSPAHHLIIQQHPELRQRQEQAVQMYEKRAEHSAAQKEPTHLTPKTSSGQSPLAYRLAAAVLFFGVVINIVDMIVGGSAETVATLIIDFGLAVGLIRLKAGARNFTLFRAVLGAILWPILMFVGNDVFTAIIMSLMQWGYCGALILLLTGRSKTWRLVLAIAIFVVFVLSISGLVLLFILLAQVMGT